MCVFAAAAITGPHAGRLNPQKGLVSQFWRLKSELAVSPGLVPSEAVREDLPHSLPQFPVASAILGVPWLVNASPRLCLRLHTVLSPHLCVSEVCSVSL